MKTVPLTGENATPSIAELVDAIGPEATRRLSDVFGGMSRCIGKPAQAIVDAIGPEAAMALREFWGEGRIYIPRRVYSFEARAAEINTLRAGGMTIQAIARQMRLTERQIYSVLASAKTRPKATSRRLVSYAGAD